MITNRVRFLEVQQMIHEISAAVLGDRYTLTDWELKFIGSVGARTRVERPLTDPQDEALEKLWKKVMGHA